MLSDRPTPLLGESWKSCSGFTFQQSGPAGDPLFPSRIPSSCYSGVGILAPPYWTNASGTDVTGALPDLLVQTLGAEKGGGRSDLLGAKMLNLL